MPSLAESLAQHPPPPSIRSRDTHAGTTSTASTQSPISHTHAERRGSSAAPLALDRAAAWPSPSSMQAKLLSSIRQFLGPMGTWPTELVVQFLGLFFKLELNLNLITVSDRFDID